jgi:predicted nucleic acid-binding Zn ribbon protein
VETLVAFLQKVACGIDIQKSQFEGWLPDFSKPRIDKAMEYLRGNMALPFWQSRSVSRPVLSKDGRQAYEEVFRYKLRVVWHRAIAGNNNPQAAAAHLRTETLGFEGFIHNNTLTTLEPWCQRTDSALRWLEDNTHKLRICAVATCSNSRYFIATKSRKTYCSDYCQDTAEVERSRQRARRLNEAKDVAALGRQGSKKPRLTSEGRERISKAAKAMWEKRRMGK